MYKTVVSTQSPFKTNTAGSTANINMINNRNSASAMHMRSLQNYNTLSVTSRDQLNSTDFRRLIEPGMAQ